MRLVVAVVWLLLCVPSEAIGQESSAIDWSEHSVVSGVLLTAGDDSLPRAEARNLSLEEMGATGERAWLWGLGIGAAIGAVVGGGFGVWIDNIENDGNFRLGRAMVIVGGIGSGIGALLGAAIGNQVGWGPAGMCEGIGS